MTLLHDLRSRAVAGTPSRALRYLPVTTFLLDTMIILASVSLAVLGRTHWTVFDRNTNVDQTVGGFGVVTVILWLALIAAFGAYSSSVFVAGTDEYKQVLRATLFTFGLVGVAAFLAKLPLARGFFVLALSFGLPALLLGRLALRRTIHRAHRRGRLLSRVLIAGSIGHIDEVTAVLERESFLGYDIVGALAPSGETRTMTAFEIPVLGATEDVVEQVLATRADVVFFAGGSLESGSDLQQLAWDLEKLDVQLVVAPAVSEVSRDRVRIRPVGGLPLIHVAPPRAAWISRAAKRTFDIAGALGALLVFSPVMLVALVWVRLADGGPALFSQIRVGRDGRTFSCYKFRSMVTNAEELLDELHEEHGYHGGLFKLADDPRITRPGRILRKYSLDELPQLFNVLRGDMSLVGPRPPLPLEVAQYEKRVERRLNVRPGLTGLWQVSGRSDLAWDEAVRLDLYYVDNWSMLQDINILLKTIRVVLRPEGAY